jgi:hypothetical protein
MSQGLMLVALIYVLAITLCGCSSPNRAGQAVNPKPLTEEGLYMLAKSHISGEFEPKQVQFPSLDGLIQHQITDDTAEFKGSCIVTDATGKSDSGSFTIRLVKDSEGFWSPESLIVNEPR